MNGKVIPVMGAACLVLLLAGCHKAAGSGQRGPVSYEGAGLNEGIVEFAEPSEPKIVSDGEYVLEEQKLPSECSGTEEKVTESQNEALDLVTEAAEKIGCLKIGCTADTALPAAQEEPDISDTESEMIFGAIQKYSHPSDLPPEDTVRYTESRKEEIMETQYVKSVVDENDPSTYEIIKREPEVPRIYVNQVGDIKYAYENGVWYEYRYSNGNVVFGNQNDDLALALLKPPGKYDRLEAIDTECRVVTDENGEIQYRYYVRYQGIRVMEKEPADLDHLTEVHMETAAVSFQAEEKVPILMEVRVGTGRYRYYGWQKLDGKTYYFDEHGERVTGSQVIRGIRHVFDEQGVKISKAGAEVSEENGTIAWEKAAEAGIDRALIQCAYRDAETGTLIPDTQAVQNIKGAGRAGLETGLSLFSQAVTEEEALEEAEFLIRMAEKYKTAGPLVLETSYANPEHNGRADQLGEEERTKYIKMCCDRIQEAGYTPMIHTDEVFLMEALEAERLSEYQFWLTVYDDSDLTYTGLCAVRQYTDRGTVNGISGYAGLNISLGE